MNLDVEGKLVDFMTETCNTLGRIEQFQTESQKDRQQIHNEISAIKDTCRICSAKIPAIESGLNNHLQTHDKIVTYIAYPVGAAVLIAALAAFFRLVLHVF